MRNLAAKNRILTYLTQSCLYSSRMIMSLIILGMSTERGHPVFLGSLLHTVLKKDSQTNEEMLL